MVRRTPALIFVAILIFFSPGLVDRRGVLLIGIMSSKPTLSDSTCSSIHAHSGHEYALLMCGRHQKFEDITSCSTPCRKLLPEYKWPTAGSRTDLHTPALPSTAFLTPALFFFPSR